MDESGSDMSGCTPPDITEAASSVIDNLLPKKSIQKYENTYITFNKWKNSKNVTSFSENVLLVYFSELSKTKKPSTLWSHYSMLKSTLNTKENINIANYQKLKAFLKRQSTGFKSKKSKIFTPEQIKKFLNEAPDNQFLAVKVALVLGITGACRTDELVNLKLEDVEPQGDVFLIHLPNTKTNVPCTFTVAVEFRDIVEKYKNLRLENTPSNRFFQNFQNGKCTLQVIGKNKLANMPMKIAEYLNLPNPKDYTGHALRRTSATLLADGGADILTLKRHGGWKSATVAEGYIDDSINHKRKTGNLITKTIRLDPSSSSSSSSPAPEVKNQFTETQQTSNIEFNISSSTEANNNNSSDSKLTIQVSHCTNVTFNVTK